MARFQKFPGCPFPIIASPLPTLLTFLIITSLWPSPVHIQYFTCFISLLRCYPQNWILSSSNNPMSVQNQIQGEIILKHHKYTSRCRLLTRRAKAKPCTPIGFVCRANMSRPLNYYKILCFLFLSDELKINGTVGKGSHGCVSATSAKGQPSLSLLTEALFSLPLIFCEEGKKGVLSPAAWTLQRMAWFFRRTSKVMLLRVRKPLQS